MPIHAQQLSCMSLYGEYSGPTYNVSDIVTLLKGL